LHEPTAEAAPSATEEAAAATAGEKVVQGRSLGRIAWERLKRDKLALAGGIVVLVLIVIALLAPVITHLLGQDPDTFNEKLIDPLFGTPTGSLGGVSGDHLLGVEPVNGRDILFTIALVSVMPNNMLGLSGSNVRVFVMILVIGFFGWPYIGRVVRGQTLSMREREYVEAARSLGAGRFYILFKELLPNLVAPIIVYTTMMIPTNILTEAALSFLGVGVKPPTSSWGQMLSSAIDYYESDPMYMVVPGVAIFITVLAFNLFGDGVRDALDPKASR
jgi:peptide/nickel transport system permease protein